MVNYNYRIQNIDYLWRLSDMEYKWAWRDSGGDGHVLHLVLDSSDMVIYIHTICKLYLNK